MSDDMLIGHMPVKHQYARHSLAKPRLVLHYRRMNIPTIRKLRGLTQADLAEMAGVQQSTISRAENLDRGTTIGQYLDIASALGVPLADLFIESRAKAEAELLDAFRRLPPDRQRGWLDMARTVAADHPERGRGTA